MYSLHIYIYSCTFATYPGLAEVGVFGIKPFDNFGVFLIFVFIIIYGLWVYYLVYN